MGEAMRKVGFVCLFGMLLGVSAGAQTAPNTVLLPSQPVSTVLFAPAQTTLPSYFAEANSLPAPNLFPVPNASPSSEPGAPPPQGVQGVFQNYNWDAYIGYSFVRFYEVPGTAVNRNGFEYSMTYFFKDWFGAEGEFTFTRGTQNGQGSRFETGMGGAHVRIVARRGMELWAHGLAGGVEFTPQTAYGGQTAFAGDVGGGVDIGTNHRRLAYRFGADMVATRLFSTYQISPKFTAGVIFRF